MPLKNYGLLTGNLVDHGPQHGGNPHYLLSIKAGIFDYRVAINLMSTLPQGDSPGVLQYQIIDDLASSKLAKNISNKNSFILRDATSGDPSLDYLRDDILNFDNFIELKTSSLSASNKLFRELKRVADLAKGNPEAFVAVFGTGYPDQDDRPSGTGNNPLRAALGFTGVDNVHFNQGNYLRVGTQLNRHYDENGIHQDGAVLFFLPGEKVIGFFTKFDSQASSTDDFGNPTNTGVSELDSDDSIKPSVRRKLLTRPEELDNLKAALLTKVVPAGKQRLDRDRGKDDDARRRSAPAPHVPTADEVPVSGTSGGDVTSGYIFNDASPADDPNEPFKEDDDSQYRNSPFVKNFAEHGVPEPVPGPRNGAYPVMQLQEVIGKAAISAITKADQIVFHVAGDTGAPAEAKLPNEMGVADLMLQDFAPGIDDANKPVFFYHVGDVVYFYGEEDYYYSQFYKPYKDYPAPIFAIPGNHDGITYKPEMVSLAGFINAFCDDQPRHWSAAAGIGRSTMTQPGVYFTLECPFVTIIGLYTNCSESFGYLDDQQKLFLYNELVRLKPMREKGDVTAILLAVHHSPLSYSSEKPASQALRDSIEKACDQAGIWPDAIISGHAHIFQRMTRDVEVNGQDWQIPHIITGSGGYALSPKQEVQKQEMALLDQSDPEKRLHSFIDSYGYMRLTVKPGSGKMSGTLRFEFHSPSSNSGLPLDVCVLDLDSHKLVS